MPKLNLKTKLQDLQLRASESMRLNESSRQHTYRTLAQAYFYWRECQSEPDFLEKQYKRMNIESRNRADNQTNFRPFVRLVFGITQASGYNNNKASHWGKVLRKLDELYTQSPAKYQVNGEGVMALDIDTLGGITNIVVDDVADADPNDTPSIPPSDIKDIVKKKLSSDELAKRGRILLTTKGIGGIGSAKPRSHLASDADNLVALIGRREKDGSITLLGSTNQAEAIDALAVHATKRNYHLIPKSLRQIAEVLSIPLFPYHAKPKGKAAADAWEKRIYYDQVGHYPVTKNGKKKKVPIATPRRLLIRGTQKDIIYSNMRMDCCVVLRCMPDLQLSSKAKNLYLKTEQRKYIDEAIGNSDLELYTADPKSTLLSVDGAAHCSVLKVSNPYSGTNRMLHFYEEGRVQNNAATNWQGHFNWKKFKANWKTKVDTDWLVKFRIEFLDEWFKTLGRNTQIKRDNNYVFAFSFTATQLSVKFNIGDTGNSPQRKFALKTQLPNGKRALTVKLRSKDIAPIFYNLSDAAMNGAVSVGGNDQAILIEFKTDMGDYQIAVPVYEEYNRKKASKLQSLFQREV